MATAETFETDNLFDGPLAERFPRVDGGAAPARAALAADDQDEIQAEGQLESQVESQNENAALRSICAALATRLAMPVTSEAGGASVELDVPGWWATATWQHDRSRVFVRLGSEEPCDTPVCRDALDALLQSAAAAVAGVVVSAPQQAEHGEQGLFVRVDAVAAKAAQTMIGALVEAFETVTVAARLVAAEAEVLLADPALAAQYVAIVRPDVRNRSSVDHNQQHNQQEQQEQEKE